MFKRVYKELAILDVSCNVIENSNELYFNYKNKNMHVIFTRPYPFNPPDIYIDDKYLTYTYSCFPNSLLNHYITKHSCMCCKSVLCSNNWSPMFTLKTIFDEYFTFVEILKNYSRVRIFKYINLPDDMIHEIVSYLDL